MNPTKNRGWTQVLRKGRVPAPQVKLQWDNADNVVFVLVQHALSDYYSINLLKQQSTGRHVTPPGHINLIPNQLIFALAP